MNFFFLVVVPSTLCVSQFSIYFSRSLCQINSENPDVVAFPFAYAVCFAFCIYNKPRIHILGCVLSSLFIFLNILTEVRWLAIVSASLQRLEFLELKRKIGYSVEFHFRLVYI